jgi:alkyl sulfatase BDS1-like metallo-beta-lactamase superfamily hydrolase
LNINFSRETQNRKEGIVAMPQNPPTSFIEAAHAAALESLSLEDAADSEDAERGFLGARKPAAITNERGEVVFDSDTYAFLEGDPPTTVHPSLWRQSKLVAKQGLFEVIDGIYQVRGLDLSNITLVEGDTGIIVIDPLISTARLRPQTGQRGRRRHDQDHKTANARPARRRCPVAGVDITGDAGALQALLAALDRPDPDFDIVTP